jgi:hypothetical protein
VTSGRTSAALAVFVALLAIFALVPRMSGSGPEMDEGAVVAYAERVMAGAVPHRDFLTFYGPGNPWLVAGAFEVAGGNVFTERFVGLLYRLVIVSGLFFLASRVAGALGGTLAGIVAIAAVEDDLVWASATYGALAFVLLGLALAAGVGGPPRGLPATALCAGAGVAGGIAALMRFDFAPAVVVSALPLLALVPRRARVSWAAGFVLSAGLYVPHVAVVGHARVARVLSDLVATRSGRALPLPELSTGAGALLAAGVVATFALVASGVLLLVRERASVQGGVMLSVGFLSIGLVPWALFRADVFHIIPFAVVPLSLAPGVAILAVRRSGSLGQAGATAACVVIALVTFFIVTTYSASIGDDLRAWRAIGSSYYGFYADNEDGRAARAVVDYAATHTRPGDSLFVGPQDLRRTNYGPTFIYFMLPQLQPASYYMEMNPQTANRAGSGLAADIRRARWLILTSQFDGWSEPNASSRFGPAVPNSVVRELFCERYRAGDYRVYERCQGRAAGLRDG